MCEYCPAEYKHHQHEGDGPVAANLSQPPAAYVLDAAAAAKFLEARGYKLEGEEGATKFYDNLTADEQKGFRADLAAYSERNS